MAWKKDDFQESWIKEKVTEESVKFAQEFGTYLGRTNRREEKDRNGRTKLTTSQLRKFFGEVKRQQMNGYDETEFILLKPKLAYAVGRAKDRNAKINDFYQVLSKAIDCVKADTQKESERRFRNFIKVFEAIVAYHKASEDSNLYDNE